MIEEHEINILDELNSISKIHSLKRDDIDAIMIELAQRITYTFRIEKLSAWLFNERNDALVSVGQYDLIERSFKKDTVLIKSNYPTYFKAISENEIILVENVQTGKHTFELYDDYFKPNNIISLIDVPMRIGGELIGVMCFEKTGNKTRKFSSNEQAFALSLAIVFASTMEARQRRALQHKLTEALKEKELLIREINHRVKNNLAVIASLINLQSQKAKDAYHKALFSDCSNKLSTISIIHEMVYQSKSYSELDGKAYFENFMGNLKQLHTLSNNNVQLNYAIDEMQIKIEHAIPIALIVNEVVTNAYKHAFKDASTGVITVLVNNVDNQIKLSISDTGKGMDVNAINTDTLGMEIIKGLSEQIDAQYSFKCANGTVFELTCKVE